MAKTIKIIVCSMILLGIFVLGFNIVQKSCEAEDSSCDTVNNLKADKATFTLSTASLTLKGDILVSMGFTVDSNYVNDNDVYIKLTNTYTNESKDLYLSSLSKESGYYMVDEKVVPGGLTQVLRTQLYKGDTAISDYIDYSANKYISRTLNPSHATDSWNSPELIKLCRALAIYGSYSQLTFNRKVDDLAYDIPYITNAEKSVDNIKDTDLLPFKVSSTGTVDGITLSTAALELNSKTVVDLGFTVSKGNISNYTFTLDGEQVTPTYTNGEYLISYDVVARKLGVKQVITVSDGNTTQTINYCALSYAYRAINKNLDSEAVRNVCKSLYNYYIAADEFFN